MTGFLHTLEQKSQAMKMKLNKYSHTGKAGKNY